jgi:hypothetical protein
MEPMKKTFFSAAPILSYFFLPLSLGVWGCVLLQLYLSGKLLQLQHISYHPLTLATALLLLVSAVCFPFFFDPPPSARPLARTPLFSSLFILLFPLTAYFWLPDEVITTDFLRKRSSSSLLHPGALQRFLPGKPGELYRLLQEQAEEAAPDEILPLDLLELSYLSQDPKLRALYHHKKVLILGQWLAEDAEHFRIAKLLIFCCAADGRTISLRVNGKTDLKMDGTWIEVIGHLSLPEDTALPELHLQNYTQPEDWPDLPIP